MHLGLWGLSYETCSGCCSRGVLSTGHGFQCELALEHLWREKRGVAGTHEPAGKASLPPGIHSPSDKEDRGKRRDQGIEKQPNFLMGLGQPRLGCAGSQLVPTSGPAQLCLCPGQQHPICVSLGLDSSHKLLLPLSWPGSKLQFRTLPFIASRHLPSIWILLGPEKRCFPTPTPPAAPPEAHAMNIPQPWYMGCNSSCHVTCYSNR